ncbi:cytosolic carboxypeptidase 1 isoform X2 [Rhipicephalus sanguineus]|uniref:cytosolic carboxypeptidase 1 isoform X2 n=1 Tax=Rhipicephalus sanguineus TaxID=34632 RepID=UPI0020C268E3|nr:cytosolic carboxypeptidase 1 isoform X2 [Rhipicephalus sanguineus]
MLLALSSSLCSWKRRKGALSRRRRAQLKGSTARVQDIGTLAQSCKKQAQPRPAQWQRPQKRKQLTPAQIDECIPMLLALLEQPKNSSVVRDVVMALKEIVSEQKGRTRLLVEQSATQVLLPVLLRHRDMGLSEPAFLVALCNLLSRLAAQDQKFCLRARVLGAYKVPLEELRKFKVKIKVKVAILLLLKRLLGNKQNATLLGNEGLLAELFYLLEGNSTVCLQTTLTLECLSLATCSKRNVLELVQRGHLKHLLAIVETCNVKALRGDAGLNRKERLLYRIMRADLECLINIARHKAGRRELRKQEVPHLLWRWASSLGPGEQGDRLTRGVCQVVHRCLPPWPLPIARTHGPLQWPLGAGSNEALPVAEDTPVTHASSDHDELQSSQSATSSEHEAELDEPPDISKCEPLPEKYNLDVDLESYSKFFPELKVHEEAADVGPAATSEVSLTATMKSPEAGDPLEKLKCSYELMVQGTQGLVPLVKIAFPEMIGHLHTEPLERLHSCQNSGARNKILEEVRIRLENVRDPSSFPVLYDYDTLALHSLPPSRPLMNSDAPRSLQEVVTERLWFESRFEGGNLRKAVQVVGPYEYNLLMSPDINTGLHHRWFYFEVAGMRSDVDYTFNIVNFDRSGSLYKEGQCPLLFSVRDAANGRGWRRIGGGISYQRNLHWRADKGPLFTLSFTVRFPHAGDVCYIANNFPYGFSLLKAHLKLWLSSYDRGSIFLERQELCRTMAGNPVPLLTITAQPLELSRPYILLMARVHPGETNSSWIMKGIIDFLLSDKPVAQRVRETFVFKIVPMLNPDGVINGCHRCSLAGQDLNRQWSFPDPDLHPTIYHTKALLAYLAHQGRTPLVMCDFHGHSRHFNAFLYGCSPSRSWLLHDKPEEDDDICEVLAAILHQVSPAFTYESCCFDVERSKESTARVTAWRQFGIRLSYTYECSTAGCDQGIYAGYHLGVAQLEEMGMQFCEALSRLELSADGDVQLDPSCAELLDVCRRRVREKKRAPCSSGSTDSLVDEEDEEEDAAPIAKP